LKAIILVAGTGSRLRPLTDERPKCLVPLKGTPPLEYQLRTLRGCGIEKIALVTGYKSASLAPYGLTSYQNPRFESTNMVYSLFCAEKEFDDDLVICYGDIVFEPQVLEALLASDADFSVVIDRGWRQLWELRMDDPISDAESLKVDASGNITDIGRKVSSFDEIEGQYIGLFRIKAACLAKIRAFYHGLDRKANYDGKDFENMFMTTLIRRLIDDGMSIKAVCVDHGWLEVDTLSDWQRYEALDPINPLFKF
jgi:choline kinase